MAKNKKHIDDRVIQELWEVRNPHLEPRKQDLRELREKLEDQFDQETSEVSQELGITRKVFFELTTARNRNLINYEEQNLLRKTVVGVFGLSVGSHAALTWMLESRADAIKIIDPDEIDPTNLNRLPYGWEDVGRKKVDVAKDRILKINPYAQIYSFVDTDEEEVEEIFKQDPSLDLVVDAIDDIQGKLLLRRLAKKYQLPLVSAADVGDNVTLDLELYDSESQPEMFLGRLGDIEEVDFSSLDSLEKKKLIIKLVGFENCSERMNKSVAEIGSSIPTWPQLGATATMAGGIIATVMKKILVGEIVKSGRYYFSLDKILVADFDDDIRRKTRKQQEGLVKKLWELE